MLLNTKLPLIVTKQLVLFFALKKYCSIKFFLNNVRVQFSDQVTHLGVWLNASLKGDDDIQKQVKSLYCAANKLRGTIDQCSPAAKNIILCAYCMPMYAC